MNYYQFHIADFALHTSHLTLEEEAVYRRLLDHYYDTESPIPKKTEPVIRRLRLVSHAAIVESILKEFFVLKDDGWHNLRADFEISEYNAKAEIARENGKKGGRPKKNKELNNQETEPVILANPQETGSKANQEPGTINQERELNTASEFPDGLNLEAWDAWLKYRGRMGFAKYKTDSKMKSLAQYPPETQMRAVRHSIENEYKGIFPENFVGGKHGKPNGEFLTPVQQVERAFAGKDSLDGGGADLR